MELTAKGDVEEDDGIVRITNWLSHFGSWAKKSGDGELGGDDSMLKNEVAPGSEAVAGRVGRAAAGPGAQCRV